MDTITSITIDFSNDDEATIQLDFFNKDGVIVYDLFVHSVAAHRDTRTITPPAEATWLLQHLAGNVVTWDAKTISEEVEAWKVKRLELRKKSGLE